MGLRTLWRTAPGFVAILALTLACLSAFAATIPLPRVDDQLVGSDGVKYFVYLPSLIIDGDLDFSDEYAYFYRYVPDWVWSVDGLRSETTGLAINRFSIGPAILWSPFFVVAHLLAVMLHGVGVDVPLDGYGYLYQALVLAGNIVYGGLGTWFCFRVAQRFVGERSALWATLLVVLAGNPVYYMTVEPSMSHPVSMLASAGFFYLWLKLRDDPARTGWVWLGVLGGLMAMIRPQDGLLLALPIVDDLLSIGPGRRSAHVAAWLARSATATGAAILTFAPQLVVWKVLNGGFLQSGYAEQFDGLFNWSSPQLLNVLFSVRRGLFVWHPIFLFAIIGLILVPARHRRFVLLSAAGFLMQWYVVSSWHDWAQGDAFGGRMFIVCAPIFVIGLATLVERLSEHWPWRTSPHAVSSWW